MTIVASPSSDLAAGVSSVKCQTRLRLRDFDLLVNVSDQLQYHVGTAVMCIHNARMDHYVLYTLVLGLRVRLMSERWRVRLLNYIIFLIFQHFWPMRVRDQGAMLGSVTIGSVEGISWGFRGFTKTHICDRSFGARRSVYDQKGEQQIQVAHGQEILARCRCTRLGWYTY